MADERPMDEPSPTIVGPQPAQADGDRRLKAPCGLEHLLALACLSREWREKVLADPLRAAHEAGLGLSAKEKTVIRSVPAGALEAMVASFSRRAPVKPDLSRTASWAAAAALLASSLTGCDALDQTKHIVVTGIQEDEPPAKEEPVRPEQKKARETSAGPAEEKGGGQSEFVNSFAPGGIRGDEPLPKEGRIMVVPPGRPGKTFKPGDGSVAPGGPIEDEPPPGVSRGISGDIPEPRTDE